MILVSVLVRKRTVRKFDKCFVCSNFCVARLDGPNQCETPRGPVAASSRVMGVHRILEEQIRDLGMAELVGNCVCQSCKCSTSERQLEPPMYRNALGASLNLTTVSIADTERGAAVIKTEP